MQDGQHDEPSDPKHPADGRLLPVARQNDVPAAVGDPYLVPGYPNDRLEEHEHLGDSVRHYFTLLLKHKWLIAAAAVLFVMMGGLYTSLKTPLYVSTVRIQIDRESVKVVESGTTTAGESDFSDYLRTQYELLKSRAMSERVVSMLALETDQGFFEPRNPSMLSIVKSAFFPPPERVQPGAAALQAWAAGIVAGNLLVRPVSGSRLVDISYKDPDPGRAERIANAFADAYIAANIDKRFQANKYARTFLEDQIKQLKIRLEDSEKALLTFAEREKIIATNEQASISESNLSAANVALGKLISERIKNEQLWRQVESNSSVTLPQFLSNSAIRTLRAQRKSLMKEYEEKIETFKPGYPAMREITKQIKEIDRQLVNEIGAIRSSIKATYENSANQEAEMKRRIDKLRAEVLSLQKKQIQYNILKREVDTNRGLYKDLLQRFKEVDIAGGVGANNVFVVDRAQRPGAPTEPRFMRAILLSLLLGIGVGVGAAVTMEVLDDRIHSPGEVEQLTGLTTIGVIPRMDSQEKFNAALVDTSSIVAEAYRTLGTALQFSSQSGLPKSLTVTSSGPGEGKSSTAFALARHFATLGLKVLLVDADLRKPSLHTYFGADNTEGLTNYLTGAVLPPEVIRQTDIPNLAFIASGPLPPNAADLLGGTRMYSLISVGLEVFDFIVIDSPPMLGLADAQLLSNATSATLFVVAAGQQKKGAVETAVRRLAMARTPMAGTVVSKLDIQSAGYGYGYGYSHTYGSDHFSHGRQIEAREVDKPDLG